MMATRTFDVHVHDPDIDHEHSEDCWCEPSKVYWLKDKNGRWLHVLEHNDIIDDQPEWVEEILDQIGDTDAY